MSKILVTGAAGLFGINYCFNSHQQHSILGTVRQPIKRLPFETTSVDLLEKGSLAKVIDRFKPDVLIHAAANANLDDCEKNPREAFRLNAELPGFIAEQTAQRGIQLIHISTDAVFFDSSDRHFKESDSPNPAIVYSESKLESEEYVLSTDSHAIVARVNFFGWSMQGNKSLSEFFFNALSENQPCFGFPDVFFCPLYVEDLAEIFNKMLEKELHGLYHVTGSEALSKFEFGQRIAKRFGYDIHLISPKKVELSTLHTPRSHNLRLDNTKLYTDLGMEIPGVTHGIDRFYTQYKLGYPQKLRSYQQK